MIEGLHVVAKRKPGKPVRWYVYAWRNGGPLIAKRIGGGRPILTREEVQKASEALATLNKPDTGSLLALIREWRSEAPSRRSSPEWDRLAASTKKVWGSHLNRIEEKWGKTPLALWNDPRMRKMILTWRDSRRDSPRSADLGVDVLRALLRFGVDRGRLITNVAERIPALYRGGDRAEIVWTDEDIDRFCWYAVMLEMPHLIDAIWLAALTGLRRADLASVSAANVFDHAIMKKALKVSRGRRRFAVMPRIPELSALLDELSTRRRASGVTTLLVNSRGLPWSEDGLSGSFNKVRDAANIVHVDPETGAARKKRLHDVRGTFATRLILSGLTNEEVADIMGWSLDQVSAIRRLYVDQARVVVAIGERIAAGGVNRGVNRFRSSEGK